MSFYYKIIKCFPEVNKVHLDRGLPLHTLLNDASECECLFHSSPFLPEASVLLTQPLTYILNCVDHYSS